MVVGSCGDFLPFGSTFSDVQWKVRAMSSSHYPSLTQSPPLHHHPNPPLCPLEKLIRHQQALRLPVIQCFLTAHTYPSILGSTILGLGDCTHIFAGPLPTGFFLPIEDSGEQKVKGRKQFPASGSAGMAVVGNCGSGSRNQSILDSSGPNRAVLYAAALGLVEMDNFCSSTQQGPAYTC